ncbi:MAG: NAD-dependent epimerase/dehydratase family protein [Acidobacteria bacterium]|nr:NAD-dependent epimerase/dehydratase family protein [Acidobacteriota bacterium]
MRALVTGGYGFVGSNLTRRLLAEGHDAAILARPESNPWRLADGVDGLRVFHGDLLDENSLAEAFSAFRPDVVFHCAMSPGHPRDASQRTEMLAASALGTANVLEAALRFAVERFVHLGSFLAYGRQSRQLAESSPVAPITWRGAAKAAASLWVQQFAAQTQLSAVELRLFSVYGPWEGAHRFIPALLESALDDRPFPLLRGPLHDWVYVGDVVEACLRAAQADLLPGEVFNIGSGTLTSNEEVVEIARRVTGCKIAVNPGDYPASPVDAASWQADISAAGERLNWTPQHSLQRGLAGTFEWIRRQRGVL